MDITEIRMEIGMIAEDMTRVLLLSRHQREIPAVYIKGWQYRLLTLHNLINKEVYKTNG